ncbi:MAG: hypothetical protein WBO46_25135 [Caldilineaceae bacterium]
MTPLDSPLPPVWENAGFLIGFILSLLILSFIVQDSWLVRAAQYLLVGVTLAYTSVLVWSNVLWPRLFAPLLTSPLPLFQNGNAPPPILWDGWLPLVGGLLLWAGGFDYLRRRHQQSARPWLRNLAAFPLALLTGVGLGAGLAGAIQGTLLPQVRRAGEVGHLLGAAPSLLLTGLLTLAVAGGALLHLYWGTTPADRSRFPWPLRPLLAGWAWLGERALWLTAGVIFARLFASRITLLIARLDALFFSPQIRELWHWLLTLGQGG